MQDILTVAINATTIAAVSFFLMQFFAGFMNKHNRIAPGQLSLFNNDELLSQCYAEMVQDDGEWLAEVQQVEPQPVAAMPTVELVDRVVPFVRPVRKQQVIDWAAMAPVELRKACQQNGIKWRNARGKNKHLSKREMVEALSLAATA